MYLYVFAANGRDFVGCIGLTALDDAHAVKVIREYRQNIKMQEKDARKYMADWPNPYEESVVEKPFFFDKNGYVGDEEHQPHLLLVGKYPLEDYSELGVQFNYCLEI